MNKKKKNADQSNTKEGNREEEQSKIRALEIEAWTERESSGRIRGREEAEGDTDRQEEEKREEDKYRREGKNDLKAKEREKDKIGV